MISALIVAAGQGVRMGADHRKQYLPLGGQPILAYSLQAFDACACIERIVLVVPAADMMYCRLLAADLRLRLMPMLVPGGPERQDSVYNGLQVIGSEGVVLIHDGVRPLVSAELIQACIDGAQQWGACIPAVEVSDTLKAIDSEGFVERTVSRAQLRMAQTPQAFHLPLILKAHALARQNAWRATDDASLVEQMGAKVHIIPGLAANLKITTPEDLLRAEAYLAFKKQSRTGTAIPA